MKHALIIDDDLLAGRQIKERLIRLGFSSFDHVWNDADALEAAQCRLPDLVIIGETIDGRSPFETARRISDRLEGVPILFATRKGTAVADRLPRGVSMDGPFALQNLTGAISQSAVPAI